MGRSPLLLLLLALSLPAQSPPAVPTPAEFLGFEPGTDRKLADYGQVCAYFEKLAATTDRVRFTSIGKTTEGRDLGFAVISSAANLARLEEIREDNLALVDPRRLKAGEAERLIAHGKTIVCLNASIHSTEVGPTQATLPLAHLLATTRDPEWLKVLDDVVLLMLPCHNPDGYVKVVDWYRRWVGTPHEGCTYPGLYHPFAGHDNNRDWFMFNLKETRLTVEQVYQRWVPQIVIDQHQMQWDGARMFMPPYEDPIEPNVDPLLIERLNGLGRSVQQGLIAKGLKGIVTSSLFDGWSPSRAYMHYHGGVRFLVEVASCKTATPIEQKGLDRRATSRPDLNPAPWKGERWALADIVRYHDETALAVLRHASVNRAQWLWSFHQTFRNACGSTTGPAAYVIPFDGGREDLSSAWELLRILELGQVECSILARPVMVGGREVREGVVVQRGQPFFTFARALLENWTYPVVRETPDGPMRKPYDVTAHCLPVMFGVEVLPLPAVTLGTRLRKRGGLAELPRVIRCGFRSDPPPPPRIGVYRSFIPNVMDEGWLRLWLDEELRPGTSASHASLSNDDVRALGGPLTETRPHEPRVLILPSLTADQIINGNRGDEFPPECRGGIGDEGSAALDRWVRAGGTLIAIKDATALPIMLFKLPIKNALSSLPEGRRLTIPGAILRVDLDRSHEITGYLAPWAPAMFDGGKAFEPDPTPELDHSLKPAVVGQWAPAEALRLAGHADGLDLIAGKAAVVQCDVGEGQVILFGFSPHFRCQTRGTFPLLESAVWSGLRREVRRAYGSERR